MRGHSLNAPTVWRGQPSGMEHRTVMPHAVPLFVWSIGLSSIPPHDESTNGDKSGRACDPCGLTRHVARPNKTRRTASKREIDHFAKIRPFETVWRHVV